MSRDHSLFIEPLESRRLLSAGQLDLSFGAKGIAALSQFNISDSQPDMIVLADGKILVGGLVNHDSVQTLALARLTSNGSIDQSFGGPNGEATGAVLTNVQFSRDVHLLPLEDGRFIVYSRSEFDRFNADGTLDRSFHRSQLKTLGSSFDVEAVDVRKDGKLIVGGSSNGRFAVIRLNSDGTIDPTWNHGRWAHHAAVYGVAVAVRCLDDGSIVAAGLLDYGYPTEMSEFRVEHMISLKLNSKGKIDGQYGANGVCEWSGRYFAGAAVSAFVSPDGVATITASSDLNHCYRATAAGKPGPGFGSGIGFEPSKGNGLILDTIVQADGATVLVGEFYPADWSPGQNLIQRLLPSAKPDPAFNNNGMNTVQAGISTSGFCDVEFARDGRIIAAANVDGSICLARFWREEGPVGELEAPELTQAGAVPYRFAVTFRDDAALDTRTIGASVLQVITPNGGSLGVSIIQRSVPANKAVQTVTFKLAAPAGRWTPARNGIYMIRLLPNRVFDRAGNAAADRTIGSFEVIV